MLVIPFSSSHTALTSRVKRDMSKTMNSELLHTHTVGELPRPRDSTLLDFFIVTVGRQGSPGGDIRTRLPRSLLRSRRAYGFGCSDEELPLSHILGLVGYAGACRRCASFRCSLKRWWAILEDRTPPPLGSHCSSSLPGKTRGLALILHVLVANPQVQLLRFARSGSSAPFGSS